MNVGEQIAKYRKERHLTQEQLGEAVGVTNRTVSKWEAGVSMPGVDLIPSVASALGISLDQLFGIEPEKKGKAAPDAVREAIAAAVREVLPDALEEALDELMPQYLSSAGRGDEYSLLVISRDKCRINRFYGLGYVNGPLTYNGRPGRYLIEAITPGTRESHPLGDYETREEAAATLEKIIQAYTQQRAKIEL